MNALEVLPLHLELDLSDPHVPLLGGADPVALLQGVLEVLRPNVAIQLPSLQADLIGDLKIFLEEQSLLSFEPAFHGLDLLLDRNIGHLQHVVEAICSNLVLPPNLGELSHEVSRHLHVATSEVLVDQVSVSFWIWLFCVDCGMEGIGVIGSLLLGHGQDVEPAGELLVFDQQLEEVNLVVQFLVPQLVQLLAVFVVTAGCDDLSNHSLNLIPNLN